jgi:MFS family permease
MRPWLVVTLLCLAEVLSMSAFSTYPALLPVIREAWTLNNSAAGFISGTFFGGYMVAVPVLAGLTDRVDARRVYVFAAALSAAGAAGFALFASGFASALIWQTVAGMGLAGTYMPGLKILADHIEGRTQSRAIAFYTSTFGLGSSLSLWLSGVTAAWWGWRWAFGLATIGPALAGAIVILTLPPARAPGAGVAEAVDFTGLIRALRNPRARRFIVAYAAHCWELFGIRSWIVAFFTFSATLRATRDAVAPAAAAAAINLLGPLASIMGNEVAVRAGRTRLVTAAMLASSALACLVGFTGRLPWLLVLAVAALYFLAVMADSAALTAGVVAAAHASERGATMAVYSLSGFGAAFVSPLVFGAVLDLAGGEMRDLAWGLAFASLAGPALAVVPMLRRAGS